MKKKSAEACALAFEDIFEEGRVPKFIYSDWGGEFKGKCRELFKKRGITHIDCMSDNKASIVERFNRTLKEKMYRYMTFNKTKKYIDVLQDLVSSYNNSIHSTIGIAPINVTEANVEKI